MAKTLDTPSNYREPCQEKDLNDPLERKYLKQS